MSFDLFVCSASFEDRCLAVPHAVVNKSFRRVLVCENENHSETHGSHPRVLLSLFGRRARRVALCTTNPIASADAMWEAMNAQARPLRAADVLVDITAFTHESLLILLRLVAIAYPSANLWFAYVAASDYSLGDPPARKWLSRGVAEVRPVLGFSGEFVPWRPSRLVVFGGFESDRALEVIRTVEADDVALGVAVGGGKLDEVSRYNLDAIRAIYPAAQVFSFDPYDPGTTRAIVLARARGGVAANVIVAPMNTKVSTLGVAIAAVEEPEMQLCYPEAIAYNTWRYSASSDRAYVTTMGASELIPRHREVNASA